MTGLRVRLTIGLLVEEVADDGSRLGEPLHRGKSSVARFSDQQSLEQCLPMMLARLAEEMITLAVVHPRRGTPEEKAKAARRMWLDKLARALELPPHLLIADPLEHVICPVDGQPLRSVSRRMNAATTYEHADDSTHNDHLDAMKLARPPRKDHP